MLWLLQQIVYRPLAYAVLIRSVVTAVGGIRPEVHLPEPAVFPTPPVAPAAPRRRLVVLSRR